jgi:hypothetical protein
VANDLTPTASNDIGVDTDIDGLDSPGGDDEFTNACPAAHLTAPNS